MPRIPIHLRRTFVAFALGVAGVLAMSGCASPAKPTADSLASPSVAAAGSRTLNGEYIVTFHTRWFGAIKGRFTAQPTEQGFQANTRPGVAWSMIGGVESAIGPVVAPYVFPQGMLLLWRSEPATIAGPGKGELGPTTIGAMSAKTLFPVDDVPIELQFEGAKTVAVMTIEPTVAGPMSGTDYVDLASKAKAAMITHALDPALLQTDDAKGFFADIDAAAKVAQDDVEFLLGAGLAWRKHEKVPFPFVFRREDEEVRARLFAGVKDGGQASQVTFDSQTGIATLEPLVFLDDANVDEMFVKALSFSPRAIVLDLRSTPGADLWALRAASWLIEKPVDVGRFFGGSRREAALAKEGTWDAPTISADLAAPMRATLDNNGGVQVILEPREQRFTGPVAVLTSGRTSGTAEVVAWLLQREKRATIVGEQTAKRPTISRTYDIDPTWQIRLATYDFAGPKGERLQKRGVRPDVRSKRDDAPKAAVKVLLDQLQTPGA